MSNRSLLSTLVLPIMCLIVSACGQAGAQAAEPATVDYNRDIRPILSERCYTCHGPDDKKRAAGLRLDQEQSAFQELESGGFALVKHKRAESKLLERVTTTDADLRMPPADSGDPLKPAEIELIQRWIDEGAAWKGHWSYLPIARPSAPPMTSAGWARNPIDDFVLARLDREGLKPSPEADKASLLRRVTLDLTGLPPTVAELDAFLADASPDAYEQAVDRLLASPHYGERMAIKWLDLARYADTNGYHVDDHRNIWKFREWVIDAFNRNLPFDQFTTEQIAGDLLPGSTPQQQIASGFHRNVMVTSEGGADPEEYLTKYAGDRVTTTATVWLGTTLACAECHDHKYDPFTQQDYYRLYAYFNNIGELGLDTRQGAPIPNLKVPSAQEQAKLAALRQDAGQVEEQIKAELAKAQVAPPPPVDPHEPPRERVWVDDALPSGASPDGSSQAASWRFVEAPQPVLSGAKSTEQSGPAAPASGFVQHFFQNATSEPLVIEEGDVLFSHVWIDPANVPQAIMLQFHDSSWEHRAYWGSNTLQFGADNTPARLARGALPPAGRWVRIEVDAAAVGFKPGDRVQGMAFTQDGGHVFWDRSGVINRVPRGMRPDVNQTVWEQAEAKREKSDAPQAVKDALKVAADARNDAQRQAIRDHWVRFAYVGARGTFDPLNNKLNDLRKAEADLDRAIPVTMVMSESDKPRETFVLMRGDFRSKGNKVERGVPASLPPLPAGAPNSRLGLARWLVDPANPLVARVTVNRYWQQYFGVGLVKTSDDFGSRGQWPSHPELLDWLAWRFVASGWDVKAMQRMMVTSATYRQSSHVSAELAARDPENRLLARGPRFRLDAEMIRDVALSVSGLVCHRLGGPSVSPYQPEGLWDELTAGDRYTQSKGADLYRRGMYIYWKRSVPYPPLITFDAPNREVCTDTRPRTNTPLQALVLLNDPGYVEAARVFAQRILSDGGADTNARIQFAFRLCTSRAPNSEESAILTRLFDQSLARFRQDAGAAGKLIKIGESPVPAGLDPAELAAWTTIGNVLLNLDETITKG